MLAYICVQDPKRAAVYVDLTQSNAMEDESISPKGKSRSPSTVKDFGARVSAEDAAQLSDTAIERL